MKEQWLVENTYRSFRLNNDGTLESRRSWRIRCAKQHALVVNTNFEWSPHLITIGCSSCNREYEALLKPLFTTYENHSNRHIAIHRHDCNQLMKRGGVHKDDQGKYEHHYTYDEARVYAEKTQLPINDCSYCNPK